MPRTFDNMSDIEAANRASRGTWFDPSQMRHFACRLSGDVYPLPESIGGAYFPSSEKRRGCPRYYSVRYASPDGNIRTVGEFQAYGTLSAARNAIGCLRADVDRALRLCPDPRPYVAAFTGDPLAALARMERDPVDAPDRKVDDSKPCSECEGKGYTAITPDGAGHSGAELEPCDSCPSTTDVAERFVRDLELGDPHARKVARFLIRHGGPIEEEVD